MAVKKRKRKVGKKVAKKATKKTTTRRGRKPGKAKAKAKVGRKPGRKRKAGRPKKAVKKKASRNVSKTAKKSGRKRAKSRAKAGSSTPRKAKTTRKSSKLSAAAPNRALERIKDYLTHNAIKFELIKHSPAITAPHIAASAHIPGKDLAKTVIVKIDGRLAMVVESANSKVDLSSLRRQLEAHNIELAHEAEFKPHFPDCETGAMPPLGNLYDMDVYVDELLSQNDAIAFNAGTHSELIKISYDDFANLVNPTVIYAAA